MILSVLRRWPIAGPEWLVTNAGRFVVELARDRVGLSEQRRDKKTGEWFTCGRYAWVFVDDRFRIGYAHIAYDGCHHSLWLGFGGLTWSPGWCPDSAWWGWRMLVGDPRNDPEPEEGGRG